VWYFPRKQGGASPLGGIRNDTSQLRRERAVPARGNGWAAQCLEYDIAGQGKTIAEAKDRLEKSFVGQIIIDAKFGNPPLAGVQPAPREYWEMVKRAERLMDRKPFYIENLPPAYMIRAAADDMRVCE